MKLILIFFLIFCKFKDVFAQANLITAEILRQTYFLKTDTLAGTCFLAEFNHEEYLVTAKHLFRSSLRNRDTVRVELYLENNLVKLSGKHFIHPAKHLDLAVLKLERSISVLPTLPIKINIAVGQVIFFLGFPSFDNNSFRTFDTTIGTLPLLKTGIFSGFSNETGTLKYYIDGHNNPGFSGGPVIAFNSDLQKTAIIGIISCYYFEQKYLQPYDENGFKFHIQENSGIIECVPSDYIQQIINL